MTRRSSQPRQPKQPKYRLHKATGQGVVTINGRHVYLGQHGTEESHRRYLFALAHPDHPRMGDIERAVAKQQAAKDAKGVTVAQLLARYLEWAKEEFQPPSTTPADLAVAIRSAGDLFGHSLAKSFGPLKLKEVRSNMVAKGLARSTINARTSKIVGAFKWAVGEELIPPTTLAGLKAVGSGSRSVAEDPRR
jgi:hypothetical protein